MPKNRLQETVFTIMMVLVMVYAMICYNIALETGGMKNFVFKAALGEFPIMIVAGLFSIHSLPDHLPKNALSK